MSSRAQHYRQAERLLATIDPDDSHSIDGLKVVVAQCHADLANVPDSVYSEYLDLKSMEMAREEVASMRNPDSRQWLIEDDETP